MAPITVWRSLGTMLFLLGLGAEPAMAAEQFTPLAYAAVAIRQPSNTLLISITKAGNRLVAADGHGVIIYSADNGKDWSQASVPVSVSITAMRT